MLVSPAVCGLEISPGGADDPGQMEYRTKPEETDRMPTGIPHIIGNEAAERFSFYGMKAILAVFLSQYLFLMDGEIGTPMDEARSAELVHLFNGAFYLTPFIGAILADVFLGKYRVIVILSLVYCAGHAALALMGKFGNSEGWLMAGMILIALGAGGIKPCVSAHVGDQFGAKNAYLLPRIFNWFYFSINLGAFVSMLLTPWLLEWYGPHWAFGVPGALMALATLVFWMGRKRFAHVPAGGTGFLKEAFGKEGLLAMLKLAPVYLFVAVFWALFDQTGSTWIFQSQDMDRNFLGFEWLPSQIQSLNSVFVLSFIPIFALFIYPAIEKFWPLSSLRKMGVGFVLMTAAFVTVSLIQVRIDAGGKPNISWQILAFALLTASEIMISIVALEFAYTQAPKKMKSFIMCFFLAAVSIGNFLVAGVNHYIRIPSAAEERLAEQIALMPGDWQEDPRTVSLPGYDENDPGEFFVRRLNSDAELPARSPGSDGSGKRGRRHHPPCGSERRRVSRRIHGRKAPRHLPRLLGGAVALPGSQLHLGPDLERRGGRGMEYEMGRGDRHREIGGRIRAEGIVDRFPPPARNLAFPAEKGTRPQTGSRSRDGNRIWNDYLFRRSGPLAGSRVFLVFQRSDGSHRLALHPFRHDLPTEKLPAGPVARFASFARRFAQRLFHGYPPLVCHRALLAAAGSPPFLPPRLLDRLGLRRGLAIRDRVELVAHLPPRQETIHFARALHLAFHADATGFVFQEDAVRGLVDLLPARARSTDESFHKISRIDPQRSHALAECGGFFWGGEVHFRNFFGFVETG